MMKCEGIIFDWAGTTVDYGCFAPVQAFVEAFGVFGIEPTVEEVRKPMGMLKIDHIRTMLSMDRLKNLWIEKQGRMWTEEDVNEVYEVSEKKLLSMLEMYADPKPYVLETIRILRERGLKIGSTTGYTDEMMSIVVPKAKENGYGPDYWCSPNKVGNAGRPYPYMIFDNMQVLGLSDVRKILKVGDTVSDIKEGKNAGVISVGVIEGSSVMGLSEKEYAALTETEKREACERTRKVYQDAGADYVIQDIRDLLSLTN